MPSSKSARCASVTAQSSIPSPHSSIRRPIPIFIQQLTNISDRDVRASLCIDRVIPGTAFAFVDASVRVGSQCGLRSAFGSGRQLHRLELDTQELATILLPNQPSYNPGELCNSLDIRLTTPTGNADAAPRPNSLCACWTGWSSCPYKSCNSSRAARAADWSLRFLLETPGQPSLRGVESARCADSCRRQPIPLPISLRPAALWLNG